jgi:hypothetical protein
MLWCPLRRATWQNTNTTLFSGTDSHARDRDHLLSRLLAKYPFQPLDIPFPFEDEFRCAQGAFAYEESRTFWPQEQRSRFGRWNTARREPRSSSTPTSYPQFPATSPLSPSESRQLKTNPNPSPSTCIQSLRIRHLCCRLPSHESSRPASDVIPEPETPPASTTLIIQMSTAFPSLVPLPADETSENVFVLPPLSLLPSDFSSESLPSPVLSTTEEAQPEPERVSSLSSILPSSFSAFASAPSIVATPPSNVVAEPAPEPLSAPSESTSLASVALPLWPAITPSSTGIVSQVRARSFVGSPFVIGFILACAPKYYQRPRDRVRAPRSFTVDPPFITR